MMRSDGFDAGRYRDDYSDRVRVAAEQKAEGMEITTAPEQPPAQIIDLFEALKRSLEARPEASAPANTARMKGGPKKAEPEAEAPSPAGKRGGKKRGGKTGTG